MTDPIETALHRLSQQLPGKVSMPGDDGYAVATAIWAKPLDARPRSIVHCRTAEDVQATVRAARDAGIAVSVRGGGHDWAGRSLCNGIVIDLSGMRNIVVDSNHRTATISGGARAADVTKVTDPLQLAAVAGSVSAVGMAGLALGGGYGPLIGRFGLALDNIVDAQVVLADGRIVSADSETNPDLFWALRGGGGNFGVVTSARHRLHDLKSVHSGLLVYPFSEAKAVLRRCADIAASAPDELTVQLGLVADPTGTVVVMIIPTWCGRPSEGEAQLAPFTKLGNLLAGAIEQKPYGALLATFDPYLVNGLHAVMETCWLPTLHDQGIDTLIDAMQPPYPGYAIFTHEFKGTASRIAEGATAFGLRRDHVVIEVLATFPDASDEPARRRWARTTREAFATALPGGYPQFLTSRDADRVARSYGGNAKRLIEAKRRYDPDNFFSSAIPLPDRA
jgi:FAD binding domain/Berberine and berberine like